MGGVPFLYDDFSSPHSINKIVTVYEFYDDTIKSYREGDNGQRLGQFFMNALSTKNNSLYQNLPECVDCFYDDKLFLKFIEWVYNNW